MRGWSTCGCFVSGPSIGDPRVSVSLSGRLQIDNADERAGDAAGKQTTNACRRPFSLDAIKLPIVACVAVNGELVISVDGCEYGNMLRGLDNRGSRYPGDSGREL